MKNLKLISLFLLFIICVNTQIMAQESYISYTTKSGETLKSIARDNTISKRALKRLNPGVRNKPRANTRIILPNKNKTIVSTNTTKSHTVQQKETLFFIARKYGTSVDALKKENNLYSNDLSIGQVLQIPSQTKGIISYTAKAKETKYGIAKMFGTTIAVLEQNNPSIINGLKIGQQIQIPLKEIKIKPSKESSSLSLYTVLQGDTFYSLTNKHNISREEIITLNPGTKYGLKTGMSLLLPENSSTENELITLENKTIFVDKFQINRPLKVAILLPFNLQKGTITNAGFTNKNSLLNVTTDLYLGMQMAINSLKNKGLQIEYSAFDTQNSITKIKDIINQNKLEGVDVVIGPLYFDNAYNLSKQLHNTFVVAPMYSKKQATANNKNLVKAGVDKNKYRETLLNYIKRNYDGQQLLIVGDKSASTTSQIGLIERFLKKDTAIKNIKTLKEKEGYIGKERFAEVVSKDKENWVIFVGQNKVITMDAITNLGVLAQSRKVRLFTIENNKFFKNSDNNHLATMQFTFAQETLADLTKPEVKSFYKNYTKKNYDVPTANAIKGFDLTYDILARIATSNSLEQGLNAGVSIRLGSKFDYQKNVNGSYENVGVQIIQYNKNLYPIVLE